MLTFFDWWRVAIPIPKWLSRLHAASPLRCWIRGGRRKERCGDSAVEESEHEKSAFYLLPCARILEKWNALCMKKVDERWLIAVVFGVVAFFFGNISMEVRGL